MAEVIKFTEEEAEQVGRDAHEDYEEVDFEEETNEGKYVYGCKIFKRISDGKTFALAYSKSGSYWTDYDWDYDLDCPEVEKKEVTITKWLPKE